MRSTGGVVLIRGGSCGIEAALFPSSPGTRGGNGRRIEAAQRLLESTDLNISAVAEQTGFASAAHFRRVFRETMGVGPLQYRKSNR